MQSLKSKKDRNSRIDIEFSEKIFRNGWTSKVAVGCRVMLTYNIEVSDGLLNDAF